MNFTFLSASMPLTKSYTLDKNGTLTKSSYPHAYEFTSHTEQCANLVELLAALNKHAALGHCLLKGVIQTPLVSQSRAGSTTTQDSTQWLCLDIDGLPANTDDAKYAVDALLNEMGLGSASYILQWSASFGISNRDLRCHIFILLDRMVSAPLVKQWLIQINHTVSKLRDAQQLTKTGNSLTWILDITACQNDKLLYISPPVLKGIKNPLGKMPRIELIAKADKTFSFPTNINAGKNRDLTDKRILELREVAGMPKRKMVYRMAGGNEILVKPDSCDLTEMKQERGFVYFNINGGDSWAYYHPENNPEYIYNFKGEPTYLTKELLPEYWKSLQQAGSREASDGLIYLAFSDRLSGVYYKGTYDKANDVLDITPAKTLVLLQHYMLQHGMVLGDFVPEWDLVFDPTHTLCVDFDNKMINTFQLSHYMKQEPKIVKQCPPTIFRFMHHALGSDVDITEAFVNWCAYIVQKRTRTLTAWVLHGVEGTGKGVLINNILRPLFGPRQSSVVTMRELASPYNAYMRQAFLVICEEMQSSTMFDESGVMAVLRNFITEPTVMIRSMYSLPVEMNNYSNFILTSNKTDVIAVPKGDRRFNVAKYQPSKFYKNQDELAKAPADMAKILKELQAFYDYLLGYPCNESAAQTVIQTEDRDNMIHISEASIDTVSNALLDGTMDFFLDQLPTTTRSKISVVEINRIEEYKDTLLAIIQRTDLETGKVNIPRDELRALYEYTVGKMPESPNKFTSLVKHHRVHMKKIWGGDKTVSGITALFKDAESFPKYIRNHWPAAAATPKVKTP